MTSKTIVDGFTSLEGGCDTGRVPTLLARNQTALAVNSSTRGGFIQQRPGFTLRQMVYDDPSYLSYLTDKAFACAHVYQDTTGKVGIAILTFGKFLMCYPTEGYRLKDCTPQHPSGVITSGATTATIAIGTATVTASAPFFTAAMVGLRFISPEVGLRQLPLLLARRQLRSAL